ncbi:MAG: DNA repair protein RecO [Oscillospiraceae bacterium]|jgi:DNA repair protein RecO (recombination protein O)|nr:DNA repair protein RecO [Oscillospiraceae bacterium]
MYINTTGIILREVHYKDSSKILTVLTSGEGKLTVSAHGTHRKNNKLAAATQLFVYSHMTLTYRKGRYTLTEAQTIEQFIGLRDDIKSLALASYIADLTEALADEDSPNPELLTLCLNTIYALSENIKPLELIKSAFELRLMVISGFEPNLTDINESSTNTHEDGVLSLSSNTLTIAEYVLTCDLKKLFSFNPNERALNEFSKEVEKYLLTHLDRGFKTLDFYKKVKINS